MSDIEHLIGIQRAAGYDEDDVRELVEWVNGLAVELTEPATTQGAVDVLRAFPEQTSSDTDGYAAWLLAVRDWNERRRALLREQP